VRQAICRIRSKLEAEAHLPDKLSYIGAPSIRSRLKREGVLPLPGISTIEQVLRAAGMTKVRTTGNSYLFVISSPKTLDRLLSPHKITFNVRTILFPGFPIQNQESFVLFF
jgi:hypothetical protein